MAKRTIKSARRTRTIADRRVTRKPAKSSASASSKRAATTRREPKPELRFERVLGKVKLSPPPGYMLSVLLKLIGRDAEGHNIYTWWLAVGRNELEACTMAFDVDGADMIRCDVPDGFDLAPGVITQGLVSFRKTNKEEQTKLIGTGDPPVVKPLS
ncbi:MAG TPA: hypothetical protein VFP84_40770 [Kofleriaceae bacterium]|nr:hypothetical protein [Kofleriaceae bacterium]